MDGIVTKNAKNRLWSVFRDVKPKPAWEAGRQASIGIPYPESMGANLRFGANSEGKTYLPVISYIPTP